MAETHTDKWLSRARDAYSESNTFFDTGIRKEIEDDYRRFMGLHPTGSKYLSNSYTHRSRFFRPRTRSAIRKHEAIAAAAMFGNEDVISLGPEDDTDPIQVASASVWQEVMNYRLKKTVPWFLTAIGAYQDAMVSGVCVSYQYWHYDEQRGVDKPCIKLLPVENFRFSPSAQWFNPVETSPYVIELVPMLVRDVLLRMQTVDSKTGQPKWRSLDDAQIVQAAKGYSDSMTLLRNQGRGDKASEASSITEFSPVWVHRNFFDINGQHVVYYTLGDVAMLTAPKPIEELYFHGERPYVVGNCVVESHRLYPSGDSRLAKDIQGELNENANQRSDNVKFAMNKRYWVRRGSQVDLRALMRNVPGGATLMNDIDKDAKVVETQDVTRSAYEEQDRLNLDFDDLVGTFSQASVQANRSLNETVGGMEILTNDSSQMGAYQLRTWVETWVKPTLRQLLKLEQHYETDEKLFLLAGKKAEHALAGRQIDEDLLMQELTVSVNVGLGATSPQAKLNNLFGVLRGISEAFQTGVLQQLNIDAQAVIDEAFSKAGYDGSDRFFNWGEEETALEAQLKARVSELEAELAKREPQELTDAKVEKLKAEADRIRTEKAKVGVETIFGAMQGAEVVATTPAVAPVADQLMRAAGWQEPNPPGIDPGFFPGDQGAGMDALSAVAGQVPAGAAGLDRELPPGVDPNTNPGTPSGPAAPASPFTGANGGIETMRSDSEGPDQ